MNAASNETELDPRALAISVWENEGGSQAPDTPDGQFGRRVEMDRSWTIYHVFTGRTLTETPHPSAFCNDSFTLAPAGRNAQIAAVRRRLKTAVWRLARSCVSS